MSPSADLIVRRPQGLYCPPGDFYLDPWRPVDRAVITHAHADHARRGHGHYLAVRSAEAVMRARLGDITLQGLDYGEQIEHRGVKISLHPAGHVLGSAQVRLEHAGQVWVLSGDYKVAPDRTCSPFEPLRCEVFITESTFGLPIYRWADDAQVFADINRWWAANAARGQVSVLLGYSFGKAQRLLAGLEPHLAPMLVHPSIEAINQAYRSAGVDLPQTLPLSCWTSAARARQAGWGSALVLMPPQAATPALLRRLGDASTAFASGWMQLRGARRRAGWDTGFALSDHADWPGLQAAIAATGARRVIVTHGSVDVMVRYLSEQGVQAQAFETEYGPAQEAQDPEAIEVAQGTLDMP
jgi:putative mRNA 3-end processing factor